MSTGLSPKLRATRRAIQLISEALDLLDAVSTPPEITASLELVLAELRETLK